MCCVDKSVDKYPSTCYDQYMETSKSKPIRERIVDVLNVLQSVSYDLPEAVDNTADPADSQLPRFEDGLDTAIEVLVELFDIDPVEYINADRPS